MRYIDPTGLLKWSGTFRLRGLGIGKLGGTQGEFELVSECDINHKKAVVKVEGYSAGVGIGLPMTETRGTVDFTDGRIAVDRSEFEGRYVVSSLGFQIGPVGLDITSIRLGEAIASNVHGKGLDLGIQFGITGSSKVTSFEVKSCGCGDK